MRENKVGYADGEDDPIRIVGKRGIWEAVHQQETQGEKVILGMAEYRT